mgnify:CR=1 FL=1
MARAAVVASLSEKPMQVGLSQRHLPSLDGLRGLAILLVLVHMLNQLEGQHGFIAACFGLVAVLGWTGVQLFFVLSGFLITGILLDSREAENYYSSFYARRTLRIFPLYFAVLGIAFLLLPALGTVPDSIAHDQAQQIWLWTYTENWATAFGHGSKAFPHFWSLAVEEQFYLIWPFLLHRQTAKKCLTLCIVLAVVSLLSRVLLIALDTPDISIYVNSFCRMDALVLGGAAAAAFRIPALNARLLATRDKWLLWALLAAAVGFLLTRGFDHHSWFGATAGYTIVSLVFVMFLISAVAAETGAMAGSSTESPAFHNRMWLLLLRSRVLRTFGKYSYGIYIFHKPLNDFVGKPALKALGLPVAEFLLLNLGYIFVMSSMTFALAYLSYHCFEKHFLAMKRLYPPMPRTT